MDYSTADEDLDRLSEDYVEEGLNNEVFDKENSLKIKLDDVNTSQPSNDKTEHKAITIAFDENEIKSGFSQPYVLIIHPEITKKKGDLLSELVNVWSRIRERFGEKSSEELNFQRWASVNFNLSSAAFKSPRDFTEEISKVEDRLVNAINAKPEIVYKDEEDVLNISPSILCRI